MVLSVKEFVVGHVNNSFFITTAIHLFQPNLNNVCKTIALVQWQRMSLKKSFDPPNCTQLREFQKHGSEKQLKFEEWCFTQCAFQVTNRDINHSMEQNAMRSGILNVLQMCVSAIVSFQFEMCVDDIDDETIVVTLN